MNSHNDSTVAPERLADGCVSSRGSIILRRALATDFDWMIALRNLTSVRAWFFDSRLIDLTEGRVWLAARATSEVDTVLIICHKTTGWKVGTLGWICVEPKVRIYETGRLALDQGMLRKLRRSGIPHNAVNRLALDACLSLRDYLFKAMNASLIRTEYKAGNVLAAKINEAVGLRPTGAGRDGRILCQLTRSGWRKRLQSAPTS